MSNSEADARSHHVGSFVVSRHRGSPDRVVEALRGRHNVRRIRRFVLFTTALTRAGSQGDDAMTDSAVFPQKHALLIGINHYPKLTASPAPRVRE
jgi:hypothetical protein